jgi:hypothetical protein
MMMRNRWPRTITLVFLFSTAARADVGRSTAPSDVEPPASLFQPEVALPNDLIETPPSRGPLYLPSIEPNTELPPPEEPPQESEESEAEYEKATEAPPESDSGPAPVPPSAEQQIHGTRLSDGMAPSDASWQLKKTLSPAERLEKKIQRYGLPAAAADKLRSSAAKYAIMAQVERMVATRERCKALSAKKGQTWVTRMVLCLMYGESDFNPRATHGKYRGLGQLDPATHCKTCFNFSIYFKPNHPKMCTSPTTPIAKNFYLADSNAACTTELACGAQLERAKGGSNTALFRRFQAFQAPKYNSCMKD